MEITSYNISSFGVLLKTLRKRQHLTQQQLAGPLGVHRRTLVRWEQGDYLPESKTTVLELARHLKLNDQETRQLLEASLTAPAPDFLVPLPRNSYFTGREEILEALHTRLGADREVEPMQSSALIGLGGVGKTQLALEYAYRHALEYRAVFWISSETRDHIVASLVRIAEVLQLPDREDRDEERVAAAVQRWLATHSKWLLIWDNVEDFHLLSHFLPASRSGAILITTRRQTVGTLARGLDLLPMQWEEGLLFLLRRAKVLEPDATREQLRHLAVRLPQEYTAATDLVEVLGGLPLALDQAGAYIEETGCLLVDYLQSYQGQRARFLARRGSPGADHPYSVAATFGLLWQRLQHEQPATADLLRMCAFLQAEAIPEELFLAGQAEASTEDAVTEFTPSELALALATLRTSSLVQRYPVTRTFSLHRLVQVVLQEAMSEAEQAGFSLRAVRRLNAIFPQVPSGIWVEIWGQCERLLPHVLTCAASLRALREAQELSQDEQQELADLLLKAAGYLYERSRHQQAEQVGQWAQHLLEHALGPEHPQVAEALHLLARLARDQGYYERAERLFQEAAQLCEKTLGPEHLQLASMWNGLANIYRAQGHYERAEPLYQQALRIREQTLGPDHWEVAPLLNNLGLLYAATGRYAQAEAVYLRVLRLCEQTLGPEHPDVARPLNNLADLYRQLGRFAQAEPLCQRALRLFEQALGPEHPDVAYLLVSLATVYREQEQYEQAKPLYQRALGLFEQTLGPEHPKVIFPLTGLAHIAGAAGEYTAAESLYERALQIQRLRVGHEHPDTAEILAGLASLYERQGRDDQAEPLLRQVSIILEARLGPEHPQTRKAENDYRHMLERTRTPHQARDVEAPKPKRMKLSHSRSLPTSPAQSNSRTSG